MTVCILSNGTFAEYSRLWKMFRDGRTYECRIRVIRESEGVSAHCVNLPGVVGEGDTVDDAIQEISAALHVALAEYLAVGAIPWTMNDIDGELECEKRILIDA